MRERNQTERVERAGERKKRSHQSRATDRWPMTPEKPFGSSPLSSRQNSYTVREPRTVNENKKQ